MKLLNIQSSARQEGSKSRLLSQKFIETLKSHHPQIQCKQRDVGTEPPNHVNQLWTKANYFDPEKRTEEMVEALSESENLIAELYWADYILLGIPMYNLSVPATFKAYIDNIVRIDRTFAFNPQDQTFQGLLTAKKALVITTSAADFTPGTPLEALNFCETYVRSILNFVGIEDIHIVSVPNQFMPDEIRQKEIQNAQTKLNQLATNW